MVVQVCFPMHLYGKKHLKILVSKTEDALWLNLSIYYWEHLHVCSGYVTQVSEPWPVGLLLVCWYWFPLNNFCRDSLITLKVCRRIYHCKMQVKFSIGNHQQKFGQVMVLFWLGFCCWGKIQGKDIFPSITFEGMHWFHSKFAEWYIIIA